MKWFTLLQRKKLLVLAVAGILLLGGTIAAFTVSTSVIAAPASQEQHWDCVGTPPPVGPTPTPDNGCIHPRNAPQR